MNMKTMDIVLEIVNRILQEDDRKVLIRPETKLAELKIHSLVFMEIIVEIETFFDIEFDDDKLVAESFDSVQALIDYVTMKTSYRAAAPSSV